VFFQLFCNFVYVDISAKQQPRSRAVKRKQNWEVFDRVSDSFNADDYKSNSDDSDMVFGKFVGLKLKEMPLPRKNKCICEIMKLLLSDDDTPQQMAASTRSQLADVSQHFSSPRAIQRQYIKVVHSTEPKTL
jgi:hypothetical protein